MLYTMLYPHGYVDGKFGVLVLVLLTRIRRVIQLFCSGMNITLSATTRRPGKYPSNEAERTVGTLPG